MGKACPPQTRTGTPGQAGCSGWGKGGRVPWGQHPLPVTREGAGRTHPGLQQPSSLLSLAASSSWIPPRLGQVHTAPWRPLGAGAERGRCARAPPGGAPRRRLWSAVVPGGRAQRQGGQVSGGAALCGESPGSSSREPSSLATGRGRAAPPKPLPRPAPFQVGSAQLRTTPRSGRRGPLPAGAEGTAGRAWAAGPPPG